MPLYDYKCRACSKVTEVRHGFREPHEGACPTCGGSMARVFNPAGILFKGSGFYLTDSRKPAAAEGSGAAAEGSGAGASSPPATPAAPATTPAPAAPASSGDSGSTKKSESSAA